MPIPTYDENGEVDKWVVQLTEEEVKELMEKSASGVARKKPLEIKPVKASAPMYDRDMPIIAAYAESKPEGLLSVITFVLCTIQSGLSTVKAQMEDVKVHGSQSMYLWGKKSDGYSQVRGNLEFFWAKLFHLRDKSTDDPEIIAEAIKLLMTIPNLGLVKAAFVCQCVGFNVACIDTHNLKRLGLKPSAVKINAGLSKEKKHEKIIAYIELCQEQGAKYWWDTWCEHVAGNQANRRLKTGEAVSAYHSECVLNF